MKTINTKEFKALIDSNEDFQLIDVRETFEFEQANMDGLLIPMNEIPANIEKIALDKKVIVHCKSGMRSANVIQYLEQQHGFDNLYNLEGGILAWIADNNA